MREAADQRVSFWSIALASAALMAITTGVRLSLGLFLRPLAASGFSIASVSLVLAVGQFCWGAVQPLFGLLASRIGAWPVIVLGALLLTLGLALAPLCHSAAGLLLTLGVLSACGAGAGSFAILIGAAAQRLPAARRGLAAGVINAGGSCGQMVFAPLSQALISTWGWAVALWTLAAAGLATLLLGRMAVGRARAASAGTREPSSAGHALHAALQNRSYLCLHAGFFTCGLHIAFLVTHLPSEIALCGLPVASAGAAIGLIGLCNIGGSLAVGGLGGRFRLKTLLTALYLVRALAILLYLGAPKTLATLYAFSAVLGLTWLATVPPTAGLVAKLFGVRHLATLFGLTLLSHQTGAFFGAWLGGLVLSRTGSYQWMWYLDAGLALLAAALNLPIREAAVQAVVTESANT